jgi:hypothetical protein
MAVRYSPKKPADTPKTPSWVQNYAARSQARNQTTVAQAQRNVTQPGYAARAAQNQYLGRPTITQTKAQPPQSWLEKAKAAWSTFVKPTSTPAWTRNFYGAAINPGGGLQPMNPMSVMAPQIGHLPSVNAFNQPNYQAVPSVSPAQSQVNQFMQQMYQTPGVRRTNTRNFVELPAYMRPGYVPGRNAAIDQPEKAYRKIFHQPMTVAMQTYPQGYAENNAAAQSAYNPYGDYGYGGGGGYNYPSYSDTGWSGPASYQSNKGYKPYSNDVPRWLQGLVTWRF